MNEAILLSQQGEEIEYFTGYIILCQPVEYGYIPRYQVGDYNFCWINFGGGSIKF